jgi:hypothetical protein
MFMAKVIRVQMICAHYLHSRKLCYRAHLENAAIPIPQASMNLARTEDEAIRPL